MVVRMMPLEMLFNINQIWVFDGTWNLHNPDNATVGVYISRSLMIT